MEGLRETRSVNSTEISQNATRNDLEMIVQLRGVETRTDDEDKPQEDANNDGVLLGRSGLAGDTPESDNITDKPTSGNILLRLYQRAKKVLTVYRPALWRLAKWLLFFSYLAYTAYSLYRTWGTENATRLLLLLAIVLCAKLGNSVVKACAGCVGKLRMLKRPRARTVIRWLLYVIAVAGAVVYLALEVAPYKPRNLVSLLGVAFLLLASLALSVQPSKVNWHPVFWGTMLQLYLAIVVLRTSAGYSAIYWLGERVTDFIQYTDTGSQFLFGAKYKAHSFVFQVMPVIVFTNAAIAVLYHYGVIETIIATFGRFLSVCLSTSPIESVNAAAGVFLGLAQAPLCIKPYLDGVTESELFAIMTGNFATVAGGTIAVLIAFGVPANHLLAASVMSAPAALAIAKIMCPEAKSTTFKAKDVYNVTDESSSNLLEAISKAALGGVKIIVTVCSNILVFVAFLDFADDTVKWFGQQAGQDDLSFGRILSHLLYPLMYMCGVDADDLMIMGRLVGVKYVTSAHLAYMKAADIMRNSATFAQYVAHSNGTWRYHGDDLVLDAWNRTLVGGVMSERSAAMVTYMMCGYCNMLSVAIAIGSLTVLAPKRTDIILRHVIRAHVGANIACLMTGCMADMAMYVTQHGHHHLLPRVSPSALAGLALRKLKDRPG